MQIFFVRRGRVVGRKGLVVDKVEDLEPPALVAAVLEQLYGDATARRRAAGGPRAARSPRTASSTRSSSPSSAVGRSAIRVPQRGEKRALLETVELNAQEAFQRHKLKRASDHNARARALTALQEALELPEAPLRIECFDISNLQGTEIVASMMVMEDGLAEAVRLPPVQGATTTARTTSPRWRRCSPAGSAATSTSETKARAPGSGSRTRRTCSSIDGGKGQLGVAVRVLEELGLEDICVVGSREAVRGGVPAGGVRAGAHPARFGGALPPAAGARRSPPLRDHLPPQLRDKKMTTSVLDDVPGLGPGPAARGCSRSSAR